MTSFFRVNYGERIKQEKHISSLQMIHHLKHGNKVRGISPPYSVIIIGIELDNEKAVRVICSNGV
jgi:hypothetical protein